MNPPLPRVLLVEDDPVSAAFLREACAALPAGVAVAGTVAESRLALAGAPIDLLLVDAHLPDGPGEAVLMAMRERGLAVPAVAHTAAGDATTRDRLLAAGFAEVLVKPLTVATLHAALGRHLAPPGASSPPAWDDAAAAAALGDGAHVEALRGLFRQELPQQRERVERAAAAGDPAAVRAELHRLAASCGFVGAARLALAVRALQAAPLDAAARRAFAGAVDDLLG